MQDDDDIERRLERLAARGDARGADVVWDAARGEAHRPGRRSQHVTVLGLAAAFVAFAALVGAVALNADDDRDDPAAISPPRERAVVIAQNASSLVLFDDCAAVLDELTDEALERVGPHGLGGPEQGGSYYVNRSLLSQERAPLAYGQLRSETNTQEVGIDEPDLVETDGRRLFDVRGGTLRVVDVESAELTHTVPLSLVNVHGAVLVGDVLAVFANEPLTDAQRGEAKVVLLDVAGTPVIRERLTIDGVLVDARVVAGRVHVVVASAPTIAFTYPTTSDAAAEQSATEANEDRIRRSTLSDWLPSATVTDGDGTVVEDRTQLTGCEEIRRPKTFGGFEQTSLVTLDLDDLTNSHSTSVQASSLLVYGSDSSLYTATTEYLAMDDIGRAWRPVSGDRHTDLHRFELGATPVYAGSGRVEGIVGGQFGLSEHAGHLRAASTTFEGSSESRVTVLHLGEGELVETGVVEGLGPNEDIEGVRFLGDLGYVVTFRRVDPLYVVDLRDPGAPRIAGELKIPGYSRYLHPVGEGLLLGVGFDGTDDGQITGAAVSLFDVSDPGAPTRVGLVTYDSFTSPLVDVDHHAFLWRSDTGTAYVPVRVFAAEGRVEVIHLDDGRLSKVGEIAPSGDGAPGQADIDRVVLAGDRLLSVSPAGVQVSDAATLAPIDWVPYP